MRRTTLVYAIGLAVAVAGCGSTGSGDPCAATDCGHGECVDWSGVPICLCDDGYHNVGNVCTPDSCASDPCLHGSCAEGAGGPVCTCEPGYTGALCDRCADGYSAVGLQCLPDTACDEDPCRHGRCEVGYGGWYCVCDDGYAGSLCDVCAAGWHAENLACVRDAACPAEPCSGHGECLDEPGGWHCVCDVGYAGADCGRCADGYDRVGGLCLALPDGDADGDAAPDGDAAADGDTVPDGDAGSPCDAEPCGDHGRCVPAGGSYRCVCDQGWGGTACDRCADGYHPEAGECRPDPVDPCDPNPCLEPTGDHRDRCLPDGDNHACACDPGYHEEGGACLPDTACNPDTTCSGHGRCTGEGLACECSDGWTGDHCERCDDGLQDNDGDGVCRPACAMAGLDCGDGRCDDATGQARCRFVRSCLTRLEYDASARPVSRLYIRGTFNNWGLDHPFTATGGNVWEVELDLPAGSYGYKLFDGTNWFEDPTNPYYQWVDGSRNSRLRVSDCRDPLLRLESQPVVGGGSVAFRVRYRDGSLGDGIDPDCLSVRLNGRPYQAPFDPATGLFSIDESGLADGKYGWEFSACDRAGRNARPLYVPVWVEAGSFEWRDGVLYFAMTDRFRDGDPGINETTPGVDARTNWQGGDFQGIIDSLDDGWFDRLGVNVIWISSISENTHRAGAGTGGDTHTYSGYHSYWPISIGWTDDEPLAGVQPVDPHFGDLELFRDLVDRAHARGIRVIVDFVANHIHEDHPWWAAHRRDNPAWFNGPDNPYVCGWDRPIECWFAPYMPDLDYRNLAMQDRIMDHAVWLARETGIDGFRLDAVKHMIDDFSFAIRARIEEEIETTGIHFYMVGETFTGEGEGEMQTIARYVGPRLLTGQFDFPYYWKMVKVFLREEEDLAQLKGFWEYGRTYYQNRWSGAVMSNFLGNHDVARALSHAAGQIGNTWGDGRDQAWNNPPGLPSDETPFRKLRLAFTFLFSTTGIPLIYYGDEVGMPGQGDPDNRRMMTFTGLSANQQAVLDHVQKLGGIRRSHPALRRGAYRSLKADATFWAFAHTEGADAVVTVLNRGSGSRTESIDVSAVWPNGTGLRDALSGAAFTVAGGSVSVTAAGRTGLLLEKR